MSRAIILTIITTAILVLALASCTSTTDDGFPDDQSRNMEGQHRGNMTGKPPENMTADRQAAMAQMQQQLTAACEGKAAGETCTVQTPRGETTATCTAAEEGLVCGQTPQPSADMDGQAPPQIPEN